MAINHTRGPWAIMGNRSPARIIGGNGAVLGNVYLTDPATRKRTPEYEGNAALFAEAPAMLAALRKAADALEGDIFTDAEECGASVANARAVHGELRAILARIDGAAPAPTAQPAGAIGEAGGDEPQKPVCRSCGGDAVVIDGAARWNMAGQDWGLSGTYDDSAYCDDCEEETKLNWVAVAPDELAAANLSGPALIAAAREAEALAGEG